MRPAACADARQQHLGRAKAATTRSVGTEDLRAFDPGVRLRLPAPKAAPRPFARARATNRGGRGVGAGLPASPFRTRASYERRTTFLPSNAEPRPFMHARAPKMATEPRSGTGRGPAGPLSPSSLAETPGRANRPGSRAPISGRFRARTRFRGHFRAVFPHGARCAPHAACRTPRGTPPRRDRIRPAPDPAIRGIASHPHASRPHTARRTTHDVRHAPRASQCTPRGAPPRRDWIRLTRSACRAAPGACGCQASCRCASHGYARCSR